MAFQGAVADVLAFHTGQGREHGKHDGRGVVRALEFTGQELQADVARLQLFGQRRQLDAAAEPLVLVDDERDAPPRGAQLAGESDGLVQFGALGGAGGDLLGEDPGDPGFGERVEGLPGGGCTGVPQAGVPDGSGAGVPRPGQLGPGGAGLGTVGV